MAESGRIFESELEVQLDKRYGDPDSDWPMYVSEETVAGTADRHVLNGIYIHRSWLPTPLPEKMRVKFERA